MKKTEAPKNPLGGFKKERGQPCPRGLLGIGVGTARPYCGPENRADTAVRAPSPKAAFTMVEIALCIAIIGFALVAIIGVLPAAMRVQQDNRGDTLIDQDGNYLMEAIRHGARGLDELGNYVYDVRFVEFNPQSQTTRTVPASISRPLQIIGALSVPQGVVIPGDDPYYVLRTEAKVRAISGAAIEKDTNSLIGFDYLLTSEISSFGSFDPGSAFGASRTNDLPLMEKELHKTLHEVRLTFRWPFSPVTGVTGSNKKVFRALVSGLLVNHTNDYFFFEPANFDVNRAP